MLRTAVRRHQQMHVVDHQAPRVHRHPVVARTQTKPVEVGPVVGILKEYRLAVVAALNNVVGNSGKVESR